MILINGHRNTTQGPNNVDNLRLWLRSDIGVNLASDTTWLDQSGQSNHFLAPTSQRPTSGTGLNGHPSLVFNGTDDVLREAGTAIIADTDSFTIFSVGTMTISRGDAPDWSVIFPREVDAETVHIQFAQPDLIFWSLAEMSPITTPMIRTLTVLNDDTGSTLRSYENGVFYDSNSLLPNYDLVNSSVGFQIGSVINDYWCQPGSYIQELIIYNRELGPSELTIVHNYLINRYFP